MAEIVLKNVTKRYGSNLALNDVSLDVPDKSSVVLLGPSGCGKTTLLRCMAGLEKVNGGSVLIDGVIVNDLTPRERDLSMVFQNYALFPLMTAFDNIAFPLKIRGKSQSEISGRVHEIAKLLQIENLLSNFPRQLSGGEQQRVAIGRAISRQPKAFLLDEPLSNLDAPTRLQMRSELKKIQKTLGVTMIFVTHDQTEAMALADKIGVMKSGKILQYSTPDSVYSDPENIFVASFLGSPPMNMVDVVLVKENGSSILRGSGVSFPLSAALAQSLESKADSKELVLGVRSEDLLVSKNPVSNGRSKIATGEVQFVELFGAFVIVDLKISDEVSFKVSLSRDSNLSPGDRVSLAVVDNREHVFEKSTGRTLI